MTTPQSIPLLDPLPQVQSLWEPLQEAFRRVLASGRYILGPEEEAFEQEAAAYLGVKHAIGLNSGTDALIIALRALGIGPGDEVITTPFTFFATAEAISQVGAVPVFVDVEEGTFNLDPARVEAAVTDRTRALLPVHLFGLPCDLSALKALAASHALKLVEDCAQSFGAPYQEWKTGSLGDFGCYSFFPTKNLNAFGDGGLLTTQDDRLAVTARMLRMHGSRRKYFNEMVGYNSRLDELQAAFLRIKLPFLDSWNGNRRDAALRYQDLLTGVPGVITPEVLDGHVFHQYTLRLPGLDRAAFQRALAARGIGTMVYYPVPCHRLKLYEHSHGQVHCPVAERLAGEVLSLPMWPEILAGQQEAVARAVREVAGSLSGVNPEEGRPATFPSRRGDA